jgi:hypothetical protein
VMLLHCGAEVAQAVTRRLLSFTSYHGLSHKVIAR